MRDHRECNELNRMRNGRKRLSEMPKRSRPRPSSAGSKIRTRARQTAADREKGGQAVCSERLRARRPSGNLQSHGAGHGQSLRLHQQERGHPLSGLRHLSQTVEDSSYGPEIATIEDPLEQMQTIVRVALKNIRDFHDEIMLMYRESHFCRKNT